MIYSAPVFAEADVLVVGGTTGAVRAATTLAAAGKSVFLVTRYTYLGEDICAFMRYWPDDTGNARPTVDALSDPLAAALFQPSSSHVPSPMHVKRTLERELLSAEVGFLYTTYPTHLLRTQDDSVAGCIVANRSGFQAIVAPVVIDATDRALVGRLTRAEFESWQPGRKEFRRVVVGAAPRTADDSRLISVRELPRPFRIDGNDVSAFECRFVLDAENPTPSSLARAESEGRLLCFSPDQVFGGDRVATVYPDRLAGTAISNASIDATTDDDGRAAADALRCGPDPIYLLSDLGRLDASTREAFYDPSIQLPIASALAQHIAATERRPNPDPSNLRADYWDVGNISAVPQQLDVVRRDRYFRTAGRTAVELDLARFATFGRYLVFVAGGGTGGAPAGISAARAGAPTLVIDYLHGLGGVGTEGRIGSYYHGNRVGFTAEVDRGTFELGPDPWFRIEDGEWNTEWKKQWYLQAAVTAGADVWFASISVAAVVRENTVAGAVVATPYGVGIVRADMTVDATGNSDVAAAAGAETVNISKAHVAVQGTGLSPFTPGANSENTDHTFVDDTDVYDVTRAFTLAREKFRTSFDLAQLVDSRQRQQVVGELTLDPLDFLAGRTFPDTITTAESNFDSHGFTIHPLFMAKAPDKADIRAHVPFRCLLPKGLEGILVTGLGVSAHRDALPVIRMQADVQNQGYAAGRAAAMAAQSGTPIRSIDIHTLQRHLVDVGVLEADVPDHTDSFPLPESEIASAVRRGAESYLDLAVVFGHPETSVPHLRAAYRDASSSDERLHFARVLGLLGDDTGIDTLVSVLDSVDWDEGWRFTGMGQFGFSLSNVDTILVAAGRSGNPRAVPAMLRKLAALNADAEFSHMRAATLAFEAQPSADAAPLFARLLDDNRVRGAHRTAAAEALSDVSDDKNDTAERNRQLTELLLARGLYACGDSDGLARSVLQGYTKDFHGHYARHARALLEKT